jgi:hypothetical protein
VIDIQSVILNGLWILGLSVILATWSYARYTAYRGGLKTRAKLNELRYVLALDAGLLLFIAGMAATEDRWWALLLWILIGIGVLIEAGYRIYTARSKRQSQDEEF